MAGYRHGVDCFFFGQHRQYNAAELWHDGHLCVFLVGKGHPTSHVLPGCYTYVARTLLQPASMGDSISMFTQHHGPIGDGIALLTGLCFCSWLLICEFIK